MFPFIIFLGWGGGGGGGGEGILRFVCRSVHTIDLETGTQGSALLHAWSYKVRAGTGWPGVSTL